MTRDYTALMPAEVRRKDRQVDDDRWIRALLHRAPMGTLATVFDGQPFVNTNIFAYDECLNAIYMHTARTGRTRSNVDGDGRICFTVMEMGRLLPAASAFEMSVEYNSVVIFGRACAIQDATEQRHALGLLLEKYFRHLVYAADYAPITDEELTRTSIYRIEIESWSGKQKKVADDWPGAFAYSPPSP